MEMLLYQSTQFRDVKKILDRAHGFAGLLTAGGIEPRGWMCLRL